jgi:DNA ligase-1
LTVKALDSHYLPGRINYNWLNLDKCTTGNKLNLVPIGALYDKELTNKTYSSFLLACFNDETNEYETVVMIQKVQSDKIAEKILKEMSQHLIDLPRKDYKIGSMTVDVSYDAKILWQVETASFILSPEYTAGYGSINANIGIGLGFTGFLKVHQIVIL